MASPFFADPIDLGARIVRGSLQREFRDRIDPLAFYDDVLYERYRFSAEVNKLCKLVEPYVRNATEWSCAFTVAKLYASCCVFFFATGTYLHSVGDAEHLGKNTVCHAICKVVVLSLNH
ncbi:hypothetical protein LDENG_00135680 [Lucifuga dentata]|nr:hypothetical protein LDENG_00135680 [Lucifuga dentata]